MGEIVFLGIVSLIAIMMFVVSYQFPTSIIDKSGGAALFPRIVIGFLLLFIVIRTFILLRDKSIKEKFIFIEIFTGTRLIYLISTVIYIIGISYLGFIVSTLLYLLGIINYFYYLQNNGKPTLKKEIVIVCSVFIGTFLMYFFFGNILNILLPKGILKII